MRALLRLALVAALAAPLAHAQTELLWRTYVDATTLETAPDGTVTVGGGGGITRLAADGSVLWTTPRPGGDPPVDIALGPDDEVYALAQISNPSPTRYDLLVYRIDADGTLAWSHSYDGPTSGGSPIDEWDQPTAIVVTSTGTVVTVAVSGLDAHPLQTVWTQGIGADGTVLWSRSFTRTGGELQSLRATRAAADCDGNVFIVGHYDTIDNGNNVPNDPGYLLSYDSEGTERFLTRLFGRQVAEAGEASNVWLNEVATDCATGAVYVAGQDDYNVATDAGGRDIRKDAFVARYDGAGQAWQAFPFGGYSGTGNSLSSGVQNLAVSESGALYASAEAATSLDNPDRVEVVRLTSDGATAWLRTLTGTNIRIKRPTVAGDDGVTVATTTTTPSTTHYDHLDPFGVPDWTFDRVNESEGGAVNQAESMAPHPDGGAVWLEIVSGGGPTHAVRAGERIPMARVQLIHAAAPLSVFGPIEVYVDQPTDSTTPDATLSFRGGSPVFTVFADSAVHVRLRFVTPPPAGIPGEVTLTAGPFAEGRHVVSAMGLLPAMAPFFASNPDGIDLLLRLAQAYLDVGFSRSHTGVPVVVTNAVTDAPAVDVVVSETGEVLANDLPYGESVASASLAAGTYRIEVRRASDQSVLEAAVFQIDGTEESVALTVSGFLDSAANQNGPGLTIAATDETGTTDTGVVVTAMDDAPASALALAGPNPTRSGEAIRFTMPAGRVRLAVVDLLGREVAVLAEGERAAGAYAAAMPALAPGLYVLRLEAAGGTASRRVAVIR